MPEGSAKIEVDQIRIKLVWSIDSTLQGTSIANSRTARLTVVNHLKTMMKCLTLSGLALVLTACGGGYPEPRSQLTNSEAAVRAAEVAGAQSSPQSALHLKRAREQVEGGKGLIHDGENERADWVLQRAEADAELALSLSRERTQRKKAAEAKEELERLEKTVRQSQAKPR